MGYYAGGYGTITPKTKSCIKKLENKFDDLCISADVTDLKGVLHVSIENDKYHDEDWEEILKAIQKDVSEGEIEFAGEDDSHWEFKFYPEIGKWKYLGGYIAYDEDEAQEI